MKYIGRYNKNDMLTMWQSYFLFRKHAIVGKWKYFIIGMTAAHTHTLY